MPPRRTLLVGTITRNPKADATLLALKEQEDSGIDCVTDGEELRLSAGRPDQDEADGQTVDETHRDAEHRPSRYRRRGAREAAAHGRIPVDEIALPGRCVGRGYEQVRGLGSRESGLEAVMEDLV